MRMRIILLAMQCVTATWYLTAQEPVSREVRPGIIHTTYTLPGPNVVQVLSIPLKIERYRVRSFRPERLTALTEQVRRAEEQGKRVIAAVNADFFSFQTHLPIGVQVIDGRLIHAAHTSRRSQFAMTQQGNPIMDLQRFQGDFRVAQGPWRKLDGVNSPIDSGRVVIVNGMAGGRLRVPSDAHLFTLREVEATWTPGDTMVFVVAGAFAPSDTVWTPREIVIAFGGMPALSGPSTDDTIRIVYSIGDAAGIVESVGGGGRILLDGVVASDSVQRLEGIGKKFTTDRHPRTFVAIDRDSTKLFLCTVDGRQASSIGMNFQEMATFLQSIGGWNAVNLDGGGSTVMVIDGRVVNHPSDRNGERSVANSLMIIEGE